MRRVVSEVVAFEDLPLGANGSRRVVVRWSDETVGEAARWYADEVGLTEGDVLGRDVDEIRRLMHSRDCTWLQDP